MDIREITSDSGVIQDYSSAIVLQRNGTKNKTIVRSYKKVACNGPVIGACIVQWDP